jgi:hypothetical protein
VKEFLDQLREELVQRTHRPLRARRAEIPKVAAKCASFRFRLSGTEWSREHTERLDSSRSTESVVGSLSRQSLRSDRSHNLVVRCRSA